MKQTVSRIVAVLALFALLLASASFARPAHASGRVNSTSFTVVVTHANYTTTTFYNVKTLQRDTYNLAYGAALLMSDAGQDYVITDFVSFTVYE